MPDKLWDKAYLLALVLFGFNFVAGLLIGISGAIFRIQINGLALFLPFAIAYAIGQLYGQKRGCLMPQALRLWTSAYYTLISIVITTIVLAVVINLQGALEGFDILLLLAVVSLVSGILGFTFTYRGLSMGSKDYLKKMKK